MKKFDFFGDTDSQGAFKIYNRVLMDKFFSLNPNSRIIGHFEVDQEKMSKSDQGYYFAVVVKHWQMILMDCGYNYNLAQTHEYIKQFSAQTVEHLDLAGHATARMKSISELSEQEFKQYLEDLKILAAQEFEHIIPDKGEY